MLGNRPPRFVWAGECRPKFGSQLTIQSINAFPDIGASHLGSSDFFNYQLDKIR